MIILHPAIISFKASCKARPATTPATPKLVIIPDTLTPQAASITITASIIIKYLIILANKLTIVFLFLAAIEDALLPLITLVTPAVKIFITIIDTTIVIPVVITSLDNKNSINFSKKDILITYFNI